jgi:mxaC protein
MMLALAEPWVLWLLPLALLPLGAGVQAPQAYPTLEGVDRDSVSFAVDWGLRIAGVIAVLGLILGLGGLQRLGQTIERLGEGAHIVLLIDRSSSMDNTFAGSEPTEGEASKSANARRLLKEFILERKHDTFGIVAFSTSPMHVLPLTDHKEPILAAIDAMDRPGLAFTNVGKGLAMALDVHEQDPAPSTRAILFVSDGAAVIDHRVQEKLRAAFQRRPMNLYWLFLRTAGTRGIFDTPPSPEEDTPQVMPERHLHKFFESLKVPYRAFEAENPHALAEAIAEIGKLERSPITYFERIPHQDLSRWAYGIAALSLALLVLAKLAEARLAVSEGART